MDRPSGTAPIKAEYLLQTHAPGLPDDDAAEGTGRSSQKTPEDRESRKQKNKAQRGANYGRKYAKVRDELELCWKVARGETCEFGDKCRFTHSIPSYLAAKPKDLQWPITPLSDLPPYVPEVPQDGDAGSIDTRTICPVFSELGNCKYGFKCRFLGGHIVQDDAGLPSLARDLDLEARSAVSMVEMNSISSDTQKALQKKKVKFPIAEAYLSSLQTENNNTQGRAANALAGSGDVPDVPLRFSEKKRLNWSGKTYLAPLTTVGNLPFRRLCVKYGADITCSEMGLDKSFLSGSGGEWSLVRRHPSESIFGVQIAGNKPNTLVPTAEVLAQECGDNIDFVDVNCGCPIDLVFNSGAGSALLESAGKLGKILVGMNKALGNIPVTVKLRTGVTQNNTAHKLMPRLRSEWDVGCLTLHGRTRQQRYTKLADWDYIKRCVDAVRIREADEDLPPIPIFGGGDCFSSEAYWSCIESSGVDGVMIGRGALIKPWIFTEIKERREWDISSSERLDLIRQYAEYALCHFGTDTAGVNSARRYLCEALSFQYRYIPIGLLEVLPPWINDRAPAFRGRNELETLLASPESKDWVRISEMFLGPAPPSWTFIPKHKSNAATQG